MRAPSLGLLAILLSSTASAEVVHVDASAAMPAVEEGGINQGTTLAPNGDDIRVNNRYLTMNGEPWLPVMAEMHYPRVPHDQWDTELAKLKASGSTLSQPMCSGIITNRAMANSLLKATWICAGLSNWLTRMD